MKWGEMGWGRRSVLDSLGRGGDHVLDSLVCTSEELRKMGALGGCSCGAPENRWITVGLTSCLAHER